MKAKITCKNCDGSFKSSEVMKIHDIDGSSFHLCVNCHDYEESIAQCADCREWFTIKALAFHDYDYKAGLCGKCAQRGRFIVCPDCDHIYHKDDLVWCNNETLLVCGACSENRNIDIFSESDYGMTVWQRNPAMGSRY